MRYEKVRFQCRMNLFFIIVYHSSLVKGAMNAAREFVNCAKMLK